MKKVIEFNLKTYIGFEYNELHKKKTCINIFYSFAKDVGLQTFKFNMFSA